MFFKNDQEIKLHKAAVEVCRFVSRTFVNKGWEGPELDVDYSVKNFNSDPNHIKLVRKKYSSHSELSEVLNTYIPLIFKTRSEDHNYDILSYFFPKDVKPLEYNEEARKKLTQKYIDVYGTMPQGCIYAALAILHVEFGLRVDRSYKENEKLAVLMDKTLFEPLLSNIYLIYGTCDEDEIEDKKNFLIGRVILTLGNFKQFYFF